MTGGSIGVVCRLLDRFWAWIAEGVLAFVYTDEDHALLVEHMARVLSEDEPMMGEVAA
jgi:hypothetical protein